MASHKRSNMVSLGRVPTSNAFRFRLFNYALDDKPKKLIQLFADSGMCFYLFIGPEFEYC